jgi:hypothetical protein
MIPVIARGTSVYSGISYDVDAYNYIRKLQDTPGVILPEAWKKAINKFYVRLKQIGAYDQIDIMYLFIGGNAAAHKIEGKNPGGPYDITWNGAITHSVYGVAGGAFASTVIYGNTNFNLTTNSRAFTQSNASMGVYVRSGANGYCIGASDSASNPISTGLGAFVGSANSTTLTGMMNNPVGNGIVNATINSNKGFLVINRTGNIAGTFRGYRRGYSVSAPSSPSTALLNLNVYVAAINRNGTPFSSPSVMSFTYVGSGKINPMEMAIVVDNLQQALGRSVYT